MLKRRGRYIIPVKYLILAAGFVFAFLMFSEKNIKDNFSEALAIVPAGCFVSFALIENNDVREANKE